MTFIAVAPEDKATGAAAELYAADRETFGYLPNFTKFLAPDTVRALVADDRAAALDSTDVAIMDLAEKIADDATTVDQTDIDRLRSLGLTDADILDIALAAAARCFFSKTLDTLGVEPDARYAELDPAVREALTVGRAIAER
jgi:hypothetical protein